MIGQRLLVRLITPSDRDELGRFYSKEWLDEEVTGDDGWRTAGASETAEEGELIGKIVGQIVAPLTISRRGEMIRIESL